MSFDNRKSFSFKRKQQIKSYKIINDFDNINEKHCIKLDKENEVIYNRLLSKAKQAQYTIQNSGLSMNLEVPMPPRPSNRDRFILWKKRNVEKPVIKQSEAVIFLYENGFKLNEHYEAYQAIDLYNEVIKKKGLKNHYIDNTKNFDNLYTKKDKNIFRRKSMYGLEKLDSNRNNKQTNKPIKPTNYDNIESFIEQNMLNSSLNSSLNNSLNNSLNSSLNNSLDLSNINLDFDFFNNNNNNNNNFDNNHNQSCTPSAPPPTPSAPPELFLNRKQFSHIDEINNDISEPKKPNNNQSTNIKDGGSLYPSL